MEYNKNANLVTEKVFASGKIQEKHFISIEDIKKFYLIFSVHCICISYSFQLS